MIAAVPASTLTLTPAEREQLLLACELALSLLRGDGGVRALVLDLDARAVDALADRLVRTAVSS